jgi:hypothetical protein
MSITTPTSQSWADYFICFNSENEQVTEHTNIILDASSPSDDQISKISSITSNKGDSIMMYYSSVSKSIQFLHNITNIGSTNWIRHPIIVALDGLNRSNAIPVMIEIEIDTPHFTRLSSISEKDLLNSTEAPDTHPQQFHHLPFILLPPFLWETACNVMDKSADTIFLSFSKCIKEFIEKHKDDDKLKGITKRTCSNIYTFLWAALKGRVTSVRTLPLTDNKQIEDWSAFRHSHCIKQIKTTTPNKPNSKSRI